MPIEEVEAAGARLRVRTGGSGERAIVMALDPPNVLEHYAQPFVAFAKHARLVAFEPAGFGQSRAPRGFRYTLEENADVTIALLEKLHLPRPVLAFPCVSAYVALRVATKRPDLVGGLVLLQAPSWQQEQAWADRVDPKGLLRTPLLGQAALLLRSDPIVKGWYRTAVADEQRAAHMAALAIETLDHGARLPLAEAFQSLFPRRGAATAAPLDARLECPVLSVWGARDRSHRKSDPATIREHAPQAEVTVLEDAGHFPELEQPVRFRDEVVTWMARVGL